MAELSDFVEKQTFFCFAGPKAGKLLPYHPERENPELRGAELRPMGDGRDGDGDDRGKLLPPIAPPMPPPVDRHWPVRRRRSASSSELAWLA